MALPPPPPPFHVWNIKLDFPRFDGFDLLQWIFKAAQFFSYYQTLDDQCLIIVAIHLDKEVVPWYQMLTCTNPFHSWITFTRALEMECGPSPYECPWSQLFKLTQITSIHEYYVSFTTLTHYKKFVYCIRINTYGFRSINKVDFIYRYYIRILIRM